MRVARFTGLLLVVAALTHAQSIGAQDRRGARSLGISTNVARVRIDISKKRVVVVQEVNIGRGTFTSPPASDALDAFVSFGSPSTPVAMDAHLIPVERGALEPNPSERGFALDWSYAPRRPATALTLLGRGVMAGMIIHIPPDAMIRALAPSGMASLRLRSLHALPPAQEDGLRELMIRLGEDDIPLTLGRIEIGGEPQLVERADAHLCKGSALGQPLALHVRSDKRPYPKDPGAIAPVIAERHAGEDLCIRFALRK